MTSRAGALTRRGEGVCDPRWVAPALLLAAAAISAAYAVRGLPTNDEGAVLTAAARMLRGDVFYRDIDAYWFPGSAQLLALAMRVFGEHFSVARWLAAGFFCATVLALYAAALQLLDRRRAALFGFSLLAFKFLGWPAFTSYVYSDVAFAGACAAVAAFVAHDFRGASWRLVAAGAGTGVAFVCKQNLGIYLAGAMAALVAFPGPLLGLARERPSDRWRELGALAAGLALPTALLVGYALFHGVLVAMIESGLIRPFTAYMPTSGLPFSAPLKWWELGALYETFVYAVGPLYSMLTWRELPGASAWWVANEVFVRIFYMAIPVSFAWALFETWLSRWRRAPRTAEVRRSVLAVLALACFASALPRADFFHIASVYPVIWLLICAQIAPRGPAAARPPWLAATAVAALLAATVAMSAVFLARFDHPIALERLERRISPRMAWVESVVRYVQDEVPPGEPLFVYGHEAFFYFLTDRYSPWPFSQLYPGQSGGDWGRRITELLEQERPRVVLLGNTAWPGLIPLTDYTPMIQRHLVENFVASTEPYSRHPVAGRSEPGTLMLVLERRSEAE